MAMVGEKHIKVTKQRINQSVLGIFEEHGTMMNAPIWTDEEIVQLKDLRSKCMPIEIISNIMKRSYAAVVNRSIKHNVKSTYLPRWSKEEVKILLNSKAKNLTYKEISLILGRSPGSIQMKFTNYNKKNNIRSGFFWTAKEIATLKTCKAQGMSFEECSIKLGKSARTICTKWARLNKV